MEPSFVPLVGQNEDDKSQVARRPANYHPDIWGDCFLEDTPFDAEDTRSQLEQEVKQLKEEVRRKLSSVSMDPKQRLVLIDDIQRLGVAYHFEEEIDANLRKFYEKQYDDYSYEDDLHYVSLRFRILRQHGFYISCDVFEKFTNESGSFKADLTSDVHGIMNLYEASYMRVHGENVLDEAHTFTTTYLTSLASRVNSPLAEKLSHALEIPIRRRSTRLESKYYISVYELNPSHDETLARLAKVDFNLLQILHRKELKEIIRWSRSLGFTAKLPYVRDRVVEACFWNLGVYYEPKYSFARLLVNKLFKIITILDDTYDTYGTIEELKLFTEAIQRWDKSCMSQLPDYMKFIYEATLDTIQDIREELAKEGRSYIVDYMRQEIITLCQSYLQEATWFHQNYVPTYDEYMKNSVISAGYYYMIVASFLGMGPIATKDAFEWIHSRLTKAPIAANILARLINDIGTHKFEQSSGQVATAVQCYMAQFGVTKEEAYEEFYKEIELAWKDVNQSMLQPLAVPMPLATRILNLCRTLYDIYRVDEDGYTEVQYIRTRIEELLLHPIVL